jgi:hypothetical protein
MKDPVEKSRSDVCCKQIEKSGLSTRGSLLVLEIRHTTAFPLA